VSESTETSTETSRRARASRLAAAAAGVAAALACASPPETGPTYQEQVSRWRGETEAELVASWGMPKKTHVLADGGRVIEYRSHGEDETRCTTRFTLDPTGKIVRWWYTGVGCTAPQNG
jgi:hypothetical protein